MKTFTSVQQIYFVLIVLIIEYMNYANCLNMWTSLELKQAGNKTPTKKCVSPCRIFHTWCKNEGKCREKGKDCTWYCECPSNCEGFFCEKKVDKDIADDSKQTVEVKVSFEKEKKKPVSAFDKSKLAQALAGIFLKEKRTDEEKKVVLPDTIERVGNTINAKENVTAKVILNCPPGELYDKVPGNKSAEKTINQTTTDTPNNQTTTHSNTITNSIINISESKSNMTMSTYPTTNQSAPQSTEKPIVPSSFSDKTSAKTTTELPTITQHERTTQKPQTSITNSQMHETNSNVNAKSTTENLNNKATEKTTTERSIETTVGLKSVQTTPASNASQITPGAALNQSRSTLIIKSKSTSDDISTPTSSMAPSEMKQSSTVSTIQTNEKSQYLTSSTIDKTVLSTPKSTIPERIEKLKEMSLLTNLKKQKLTSEMPSTSTNPTSTSSPVQQFGKASKAPAENSLYIQKANVINIADKPNLMQIIEKAIEVEFITTTEKAKIETSFHNKATTASSSHETINNNFQSTEKVHISTPQTGRTQIEKQVSQTTGNDMHDVSTTPVPQSTSISVKPTTKDQNSLTKNKNETKNSIKHNINTHKLNTLVEEPSQNVSPKQTGASSHVYEQTTTNIPITRNVTASTNSILSTGDKNNSSNTKMTEDAVYSNHDADKYEISSTTSKVERPFNDNQKTTHLSGKRDKIDFEKTTVKTTIKSDSITKKLQKTPEVRKTPIDDKKDQSESSNKNEMQTLRTTTDSVSGKYKSKPDMISTKEKPLSSPANEQLLKMSQVITVSHDLPKTTTLGTSTFQTVMSKEITPEQQHSKKPAENFKESSPTTQQSTQIFSTDKSSSAETSSSLTGKPTIEIKNINSLKTLKSTTKSTVLNNNQKTTVDTIISSDKSETLKSTGKEALPTSRLVISERTTERSITKSAPTMASNPDVFTESTTTHISLNTQSKSRAYSPQGVTESIINTPENTKQISTPRNHPIIESSTKFVVTTEITHSLPISQQSTPPSIIKKIDPNNTKSIKQTTETTRQKGTTKNLEINKSNTETTTQTGTTKNLEINKSSTKTTTQTGTAKNLEINKSSTETTAQTGTAKHLEINKPSAETTRQTGTTKILENNKPTTEITTRILEINKSSTETTTQTGTAKHLEINKSSTETTTQTGTTKENNKPITETTTRNLGINKSSTETITQTGTTNVLERNKPTTERVIYSADVGESKLSFAKNILENKSDILKKSKVKNGLLSNKLSETVKDLKFDLLKMGLRDKGLPSDLDNIL